MTRRDHAKEAQRILTRMPSGDTLDQAYAYAQTHAILALVEQARIANLIALAGLPHLDGWADEAYDARLVAFEGLATPGGMNATLLPDVAAALGIEVQR